MNNLLDYRQLQHGLINALRNKGFTPAQTIKILERIEKNYYEPDSPSGVFYNTDRMKQDYLAITQMSKDQIKAQYT